jgi:hypothetical protein
MLQTIDRILTAIDASSHRAATDMQLHGALYETPTQNPPASRWHYGWMRGGFSEFVEAPTLEALIEKLWDRVGILEDTEWRPLERRH